MHETNGRLAGKVAIVTGAGRGIGSGVAKALAADGARVALASRSEGPLEEVAVEIRDHGGDALPLVCDVGVRADVDRVVATTADTYGRIDILVNNAQSWGPPGVNALAPPPTPFEDLPEAWWDHTFQTGAKATFYFCQAVFPHIKSRGGKIINFGSPSAVAGRPGMVDYGANKEAIRGLTKSLAREWGPYGINVNVICPVIETDALRAARHREPDRAEAALDVVPMRRLGDADRDAGPLAVFLASADSDYLTGHTFMLDGGRVMI
jgi:NAD(P)-dependent dehydrogenase (short-subunit alcohol dehydrogenase family)